MSFNSKICIFLVSYQTIMSIISPSEVVGRSSETQLQLGGGEGGFKDDHIKIDAGKWLGAKLNGIKVIEKVINGSVSSIHYF